VGAGEDALEVVPDQECGGGGQRALERGEAVGFGQRGEVVAQQQAAQLCERPIRRAALLEGEEDGAGKAPRPREPGGGLACQRGLALPAKGVEHDDAPLREQPLQPPELAGAADEAVARAGEIAQKKVMG